MIEYVDKMLWVWGDWGRPFIAGPHNDLVLDYAPRGVMSTNPNPDNAEAEKIDRILACMPREMREEKAAVRRRYLYNWSVDDVAVSFGRRRQRVHEMLGRAHFWIDGYLRAEKNVANCTDRNYAFPRILREVTPRENEQTPEPA